MSTDSRRGRSRRRRGRSFVRGLGSVLAALALVGGVGAVVTVMQGPRVSGVQVDPAAGVAASGSRLLLTTTQALQEVDAAQVEVEPATPFTVDTSGRTVGVRFTLPLRDDAEYTVRVRDVRGVGAGPAATLTETFRTPPLRVYALQRDTADGDAVVRSAIDGSDPQVVLAAAQIEDVRVTTNHLVASVRDDDAAALLVSDLDGGGERRLSLPGDGFVSNLQSADRGERIGYTFSDASLGAEGGRESMLYTASLAAGAADTEPTAVEIPGDEQRVAEWRFVPDTDSILVLTFDGRLLLAAADGSGAAPLGTALAIEGIARGSSEAVVERPEGMRVIDLTDGSERPLVEPADELGLPGAVTPLPGDGAGSIRTYAQFDDASTLLSTEVVHVADDGAARVLLTVDAADAVLQSCVSPSGRYLAVLVAPDAVDNPYDRYLLPMPERVETRVVEVETGDAVGTVPGFDLSWCQVPPA